MPDLVIVERPDDATAGVTLNRPDKKNAWSIALREQGAHTLGALAGEPGLKCVVVTGAGGAFSAGFDLTEFEAAAADPGLERRLWDSSDRWHRGWIELPVATVAAVNGLALAGGFDLAVMCDDQSRRRDGALLSPRGAAVR